MSEIEKSRFFIVKNEVFSKIEHLSALEAHGTPISLRNYCLIFIFLFPWIYTPSLIDGTSSISINFSNSIVIIFSIFISFILMALFNIQNFIENPFDQKGIDDINVSDFMIKKKELNIKE